MEREFSEKELARELKIDARGVGIPVGAANEFVKLIMAGTNKTLGKKKIITEQDLKRAVLKEIKKYNADFAYVYENRDKII